MMKLFSWFMTIVVIVLVVMFFRQNSESFYKTVEFSFDIGFGEPMEWKHSVIGMIIASLVIGFLVGFLLLFKPYMGLRQRNKEARQQLDAISRAMPKRAALPAGEQGATDEAGTGEAPSAVSGGATEEGAAEKPDEEESKGDS